MRIVPVQRMSASEQIFEQLAENIRNGSWGDGQRIPSESELSKAFHASRVTVRQALAKLTTLGLIEVRVGEGSFVKSLEPGMYLKQMIPIMYLGQESTKEVLEFRIVTEVETAGLAAERITERDIIRLERSLGRMRFCVEDIERYVKEDLHFHMIITRSTGNSLAIQLNYNLREILLETVKSLTRALGAENGLKYHQMLIDAFRMRNTVRTKEVMREHLEQALRAYEDLTKEKREGAVVI